MTAAHHLDVLIPTYNRPSALAVTLTSLCFQTFRDFRVIISDQGEEKPAVEAEEVRAVIRTLELRGNKVELHQNLPCRGMAQQRQFLLDRAVSDYVLYLDDDLILEPFVLGELISGIEEEGCGFVGCGTIGLNFLGSERPEEESIEFWEEKVRPEVVVPGSEEWKRHVVHNAANLLHLQRKLGITPERPSKYKIAWASACVLYDRRKLLDCGGFDFWRTVPRDHCGEDVAAQLRVMARHGGCGILPSGVYHQELRTTLPNRKFNIPERIDLFESKSST